MKPLAPEEVVRFDSKVEKGPDCWTWLGCKDRDGYGFFWRGGKLLRASRVAVLRYRGEQVPRGFEPDHLCKNSSCVRPDHLEVVTRRVNVLRSDNAAARNARKTACVNGHPFDAENTRRLKRTERHPYGGRDCRACARARSRASYHRANPGARYYEEKA
jgi:hypothetical protein